MSDGTPDGPAPIGGGLQIDFLHRIYRTTAVLALAGAFLIWERAGSRGGVSWLLGCGASLLSLWSWEIVVRRSLRPVGGSTRPLTLAILTKLPLWGVLLALLIQASNGGRLDLMWALGGFALPHLVGALKLAGHLFLRLSGADRGPDTQDRKRQS